MEGTVCKIRGKPEDIMPKKLKCVVYHLSEDKKGYFEVLTDFSGIIVPP